MYQNTLFDVSTMQVPTVKAKKTPVRTSEPRRASDGQLAIPMHVEPPPVPTFTAMQLRSMYLQISRQLTLDVALVDLRTKVRLEYVQTVHGEPCYWCYRGIKDSIKVLWVFAPPKPRKIQTAWERGEYVKELQMSLAKYMLEKGLIDPSRVVIDAAITEFEDSRYRKDKLERVKNGDLRIRPARGMANQQSNVSGA